MLTRINNHVVLTDTVYSVGKKLVQVYIPAVSALYFGLGNIWGFPAIEQVVGTFAVFATFIGVCLGLSSVNYDSATKMLAGTVLITTSESGHKMFSLEVDGDPYDLERQSLISFKVKRQTAEE